MSRESGARPSTAKSPPQSVSAFRPQTICVVGMGYIGLPTASVLADRGYRVFGVDVRPEVVDTINQGKIHIHEPHLDALVEKVVREGKLSVSTSPCAADIFFLCVPTPINGDTTADVSYVDAAARSIRPYVQRGNLIVLESTSPPGTTEDIVATNAVPPGMVIGEDVFVAHCPERVLPGRILIEVVENDRIVGGMTPACTQRTKSFYESFVSGQVMATSARAAETAKLVENAFRDVNIAFANELSMLCDTLDLDVHEIIALANRHPRVKILNPGPGVGGHCISVDPWFLVNAAPAVTPLIRTAREVNNHKPHYVLQQIRAAAARGKAKTIGCLGLAYKADVDDLRESPSLEIVRELRNCGEYEVLACEPYVNAKSFKEFALTGLDELLEKCEVLVLLTDHSIFREIPTDVLTRKIVIDTRGVWRDQLANKPASSAETQPLRKHVA